jgi:glycosyltransferase involved in cell wall biosynthesis
VRGLSGDGMKRAVIYFGFNNPHVYKRGVENVIELQAGALPAYSRKYYLFFGARSSVTRWGDIVAIGIRFGLWRFLIMNLVVGMLLRRLRSSGFFVVLHSHNYLASLFLWWKSDLFSVHDGLWYQMKSVGRRNLLFWGVERIVYWRSKNLHCNSHFTYNTSQLSQARKPVRIIYCSTPLERFKTEEVPNPVGFEAKDGPVIFSVRSMELRARIDLVIEIAALAQKRSLKMSFVVAGKGPMLEYYRELIEGRGLQDVKLLGFISDTDLVARYRGCDCVLLPCENGEGFGLPIIEGYLFGKPVVASDRCAVPEVINDRKYLSDNDAEEMLGILQSTLAEENDGICFEEHYDRHFSNAVIVPQFSELYDAVFEKQTNGSPRTNVSKTTPRNGL